MPAWNCRRAPKGKETKRVAHWSDDGMGSDPGQVDGQLYCRVPQPLCINVSSCDKHVLEGIAMGRKVMVECVVEATATQGPQG
jgi:hypothetical protein